MFTSCLMYFIVIMKYTCIYFCIYINIYSQTCLSGHLPHVATQNCLQDNHDCVKDPVNSGHLSIKATFHVSLVWLLFAGSTVYIMYVCVYLYIYIYSQTCLSGHLSIVVTCLMWLLKIASKIIMTVLKTL